MVSQVLTWLDGQKLPPEPRILPSVAEWELGLGGMGQQPYC